MNRNTTFLKPLPELIIKEKKNFVNLTDEKAVPYYLTFILLAMRLDNFLYIFNCFLPLFKGLFLSFVHLYL